MADRDARGSCAGDLVDSMVEGRIVLEKIKALEGRMRYQIEKLVRVAEEAPSSNQNVIDGMFLSFEIHGDSMSHFFWSFLFQKQ